MWPCGWHLARRWAPVASIAVALASCGRIRFDAASQCDGKPVGTACDDGYACSEDDRCDAAGACTGTPNDGACGAGEQCLPDCFGGTTGCGVPPTAIAVSCDDASAPGEASCSVAVSGGTAAQAACVSCEATVGFVPLVDSDFEDSTGACSEDGWQLASGSACNDGADGCATNGAVIPCCSDFSTICNSGFAGASFLESVFEQNCGGGFRQWRITRAVDASAVTDLRLCFDAAETYAGLDDGVFAMLTDTVSNVQLDCLRGDNDWRGAMQTRCTDVPAWAANNPNLVLTLVGHNNAAHAQYPTEVKRMMLDNVLLYGREPACTTQARTMVFEETFAGCPDVIPEGFHGWSVALGAPRCAPAGSACAGGGEGAVARGSEWELTRRVDTSALSGDVRACFRVGHVNAADVGERVEVSIDVGDGSGWRLAGRGSLYQAADSQCQQICISLSAADAAAAHNPDLGIKISAASTATGITTMIDDIRISGVQSCDAAGFVSVGPLTDAGPGMFDVSVSNESAQALTAQLTCTWTGGAQRHIASAPVPLD